MDYCSPAQKCAIQGKEFRLIPKFFHYFFLFGRQHAYGPSHDEPPFSVHKLRKWQKPRQGIYSLGKFSLERILYIIPKKWKNY